MNERIVVFNSRPLKWSGPILDISINSSAARDFHLTVTKDLGLSITFIYRDHQLVLNDNVYLYSDIFNSIATLMLFFARSISSNKSLVAFGIVKAQEATFFSIIDFVMCCCQAPLSLLVEFGNFVLQSTLR